MVAAVKTTVVNAKKEAYDVLIGRGTPWGNPFVIGVDGSRSGVISKYRRWLLEQPQLMSRLNDLKGKRLGCFCKPLACHGDVLVELASAEDQGLGMCAACEKAMAQHMATNGENYCSSCQQEFMEEDQST